MIFRHLLYNYSRMMHKKDLNIALTPQEELLFNTLIQYKQELHLNTVMRVAGGWVRDKIMGKESHDIDIALENMKGEEFVIAIKNHAESKKEKISSFGVTKFNPELSKHLETATAKICGQNIDFVNLRSETYNEQSRIPQIEMGTPLTDALRRDFTINALFYNIETHQVQDWTEKGIDDIDLKIIRTPLAPLVTFKDDPLRVLRCFRFKARFNFSIDQHIYESLTDLSVHEALKTKVSKQRVGIELAGMLKAKHPLSALQQVLKYKFWNIIFEIPEESDLKDEAYINKIPQFAFNLASKGIESVQNYGLKSQKSLLANQEIKDKRPRYPQDELQLLIILSFITLPYQGFKAPEGKKWMGLPQHIGRNQLKYSAKVAEFIQKTGQLAFQLEQTLANSNQPLKVRIAKWLKQAEEKWEIAIHCLVALRTQREELKLQMDPIALRDWIFDQKLQDSYLVKPFIDGNFLTKRGKKGPIIKTILDNCTIWRILNPQTTKQDFLELFQKNQEFFQNQKSYA